LALAKGTAFTRAFPVYWVVGGGPAVAVSRDIHFTRLRRRLGGTHVIAEVDAID